MRIETGLPEVVLSGLLSQRQETEQVLSAHKNERTCSKDFWGLAIYSLKTGSSVFARAVDEQTWLPRTSNLRGDSDCVGGRQLCGCLRR